MKKMNKRPWLDTHHPPGQTVNTEELDKLAYKAHPKTLGDYIDNVLATEKDTNIKKLSFEEWMLQLARNKLPLQIPFDDWYICMQEAWIAGQANK